VTQNGYTIEIIIQGEFFEVGLSEFSFSISDSIWEPYSKMDMDFRDPTGLFLEYLLFNIGAEIEVNFGLENEVISNVLNITSEETTEGITGGLLNGIISVRLKNQFFQKQERKNGVYEGTPSEVIEEILGEKESGFSETFVDTSENSQQWIRPLRTQMELFSDTFLENVYSNNSNNTPFFLFIDSKNDFHFESFSTLFSKSPVAQLELKQVDMSTIDENTIDIFLPFTEKIETLLEGLKRKAFRFSNEDFSFTEEERGIDEIAPGDYPVIYNGDDFRYSMCGEDETDCNQKGRELFSHRKSLLPSKAIIVCRLNTLLTAGQTVEVTVDSAIPELSTSICHSGKYLIEKSEHVWQGDRMAGYTRLIVGRKSIKLPGDYLIKEKFYSS